MNSSAVGSGNPHWDPKVWSVRKFSSLVDEFRHGTSGKSDDFGLPALRIPNVVGGVLDVNELKCVPVSAADEARLRLIDGDLLFVRTNGKADYVGRCAIFSEEAVGASGFPVNRFIYASYLIRARLRSDEVEPAFIREFMLGPTGRAQLRANSKTSAGQYNINTDGLGSIEVPVPKIDVQREIVEIMEQARDACRSRRKSVALLDRLPESIFFEMFGEPDINHQGWPVLEFSKLLSDSPRNGLSPSNSGKVTAKVLTLSAITGSRFDGGAFKVGTFKTTPPAHLSVCKDDFLVCRGNGNIEMVGRGCFSTTDMPDVTFPDTVIASRVNPTIVTREYLEAIWATQAVRRQIESSARTTNGTFKINHKVLEAVKIMVPPLKQQRSFSERIAALERVRASHAASSYALDGLYTSLQHRTFTEGL